MNGSRQMQRYLNSTTQLTEHTHTKKDCKLSLTSRRFLEKNRFSSYTLHIFAFFKTFYNSMGRLCQCRRHVSFWTYHKRSEWEIWLQSRGIPWGFSVHPGIAPDVICYRSSEALCNVWHPLGYRVQLLLLSYANCSGRVFLPSTFLSKWNCHCWLVA